jgi:heat shock protein HslJ
VKRIRALLLLAIVMSLASLPASATTFPFNQRFAVVSINGHELQKHLPEILFERPAFLGEEVSIDTLVPFHVSTGCNHFGIIGKVMEMGHMRVLFFRVTSEYCGRDISDIEGQLIEPLARATRWHIEGEALVLEGEEGNLRLIPLAQVSR